MNAARSAATLPPSTFIELSDYLRRSGSTLSPSDALTRAVQCWLAAERAAAVPDQGYQWKQLFLPAGTRLRMRWRDHWYYADINGDQLMYRGQALSPRQLTIVIAGDGRNAWRDLWIRRPGDTQWHAADQLRFALESAPEPPSPMEAMQGAARSMSHALQSALTLIEHVQLHAEQTAERRIPKHRRRADYELDEYRAD